MLLSGKQKGIGVKSVIPKAHRVGVRVGLVSLKKISVMSTEEGERMVHSKITDAN